MGDLVFSLPFPFGSRRCLSFKHTPHSQRRGILVVENHVIYLALGNMSTSAANRFTSHVGLIRKFGEPSRCKVLILVT